MQLPGLPSIRQLEYVIVFMTTGTKRLETAAAFSLYIDCHLPFYPSVESDEPHVFITPSKPGRAHLTIPFFRT
jgi:hypothetical protein